MGPAYPGRPPPKSRMHFLVTSSEIDTRISCMCNNHPPRIQYLRNGSNSELLNLFQRSKYFSYFVFRLRYFVLEHIHVTLYLTPSVLQADIRTRIPLDLLQIAECHLQELTLRRTVTCVPFARITFRHSYITYRQTSIAVPANQTPPPTKKNLLLNVR
jgi:hypothetical protein